MAKIAILGFGTVGSGVYAAAVLCPWAFTTRVSVRSVPPPLKALPS